MHFSTPNREPAISTFLRAATFLADSTPTAPSEPQSVLGVLANTDANTTGPLAVAAFFALVGVIGLILRGLRRGERRER